MAGHRTHHRRLDAGCHAVGRVRRRHIRARPIASPGQFTNGDHLDHIHIGYES